MTASLDGDGGHLAHAVTSSGGIICWREPVPPSSAVPRLPTAYSSLSFGTPPAPAHGAGNKKIQRAAKAIQAFTGQ